MTKVIRSIPAMCLIALLALTTACSKDETSNAGTTRMEVRMTDDPADYEEVNVDIQSVEIHTSATANDNDAGWQTLSTINSGVYNLLDFANGADTLLASANLPAGHVSQIRLKLGNNNSIKLRGENQTRPLVTPSGQQSGLKLQIHADLQANVTYVLLLDFDAGRSVVETGNGTYKLKPVIRVVTQAVAGGIEGVVNPASAHPAIYVLNGTDTAASGFPNVTTGAFLIGGLAAGSYTVRFDADSTNLDKTVTGVAVTNSAITNMGTVQLP